MSFYALSVVKGDESVQSMDEFRGKVVYATNVASMCGASRREYAQFEKLGQQWGDNLVIMGFPSREFGSQEYKTDAEIAEFAKSKNFPGILVKLGKVTGQDVPDLWKFLKAETGAKDPTWNFNGKFLVSKTGVVSITTAGSVESDTEKLMQE